jgi:hypothetical protein
MNEEDLQIDNILAKKEPKKRVNGKDKGGRVELELCKILKAHFNEEFIRSIGSGNRWGQVELTGKAKQVFTGDIISEGCRFVIECKGGYSEVDLNNVFGGITRLDDFIEQVQKDADYCGRTPLICWKKNHKPWVAMIKVADLQPYKEELWEYRIHYREWLIVHLMDFLKNTNKEFWYTNE